MGLPVGRRKLGDARYVVDVQLLLRRLELERRLRAALLHLAVLVPCLACFAASAYELQPAAEAAAVHAALRAHFLAVLRIASLPGKLTEVYSYAEVFESLNSALQVTSAFRWCERRYLSIVWDDVLGAPVQRCLSPRQQSLGVPGRPVWSPSIVGDNSSGLGNTSDDGNCSNGSTGVGNASALTGNASNATAACCDDVDSLRERLGDNSTSCASSAASVCQNAEMAQFCRRTCGFCGPFDYEPLRYTSFGQPFPIMPAVIFQSRWPARRCDGFADFYNNRSFGPRLQLSSPPSSEAFWGDMPLICPDHSADTNSSLNVIRAGWASWLRGNRQREVDGYVLDRPAEELARLRSREWLDGLTDSVTIGTFLYSDEAEMFTYLALDLRVGRSGELEPRLTLHSYKDVERPSDDHVWLVLAICAIAFAAIGFLGSTAAWIRSCCRRHKRSGAASNGVGPWSCALWRLVEVLTYAGACATASLSLYLRLTKAPEFARYFENLLKAYIGKETDDSGNDPDHLLSSFFYTVVQLQDTSAWAFSNRVAVWICLSVMFLQALRFVGICHPRIRSVAGAFQRGFGDLAGTFVVFAGYFVILGYLAHWVFGPDLQIYSTFSAALSAQLRWLFGELLAGDEAARAVEYLSPHRLGLYWAYTALFVFVLCWAFLYALLALLVDRVADMRGFPDEGLIVANSVAYDLWDTIDTRVLACCSCRRWPRTCLLERALAKAAEEEASNHVRVETLCAKMSLCMKAKKTSRVMDMPEQVESKPSDTTAKPSDTTAKPSDTTAKPSDTTAKPADTTAKPADTTAEAIEVKCKSCGNTGIDFLGNPCSCPYGQKATQADKAQTESPPAEKDGAEEAEAKAEAEVGEAEKAKAESPPEEKDEAAEAQAEGKFGEADKPQPESPPEEKHEAGEAKAEEQIDEACTKNGAGVAADKHQATKDKAAGTVDEACDTKLSDPDEHKDKPAADINVDEKAEAVLSDLLESYDHKLRGRALVFSARVWRSLPTSAAVRKDDLGAGSGTDNVVPVAATGGRDACAASCAAPSEASTDVSVIALGAPPFAAQAVARVGKPASATVGSGSSLATPHAAKVGWPSPPPEAVHIPWASVPAQKELNKRVENHVRQQLQAIQLQSQTVAARDRAQMQDDLDEVTAQISADVVEILADLYPELCGDVVEAAGGQQTPAEVSVETPSAQAMADSPTKAWTSTKADMESNVSEEV